MREYLIGVLCAAFICSIVTSVGGAGQGTRKLICSIFMALALLHPLGSLDLPELTLEPFVDEADAAVETGQAQARAARNEIITGSLEAYILTKAIELDLAVEAEVTITACGLPASVTISGSASPSERDTLSNSVAAALGIGKEDIEWNRIHQSSE